MSRTLFSWAALLTASVSAAGNVIVETVPVDIGAPGGYFVYRIQITVDPGDEWLGAELFLDACEGCTFYQSPCNDQNPPRPQQFGTCPQSQYTTFYTTPGCWPNTGSFLNCLELTLLEPETPQHLHVLWYDSGLSSGGPFTIAQVTTLCECECFQGWIRVWVVSNPGMYLEFPIDINNCGIIDCNENGIPDYMDIANGTSFDCDGNGVPDECEGGGAQNPPVITGQPADDHKCIGESATFSVTAEGASGHGHLFYQWHWNGAPIAGATQRVYAISFVEPTRAGEYYVVVSDACGQVVSNVAQLFVKTPPAIVVDPVGLEVPIGGAYTASVTVGGADPLSFQWRRNAVPLEASGRISGVDSSTLTIDPVSMMADAGAYDVVITNACGYAISEPAQLTVTAGTCPPADRPRFVRSYHLTGDANGIPWSWRIQATEGSFSDAVDLHVAGVESGGALEVAERFADSINAYAAATGCGVQQLMAQAEELSGEVYLSIATGNESPFELWVGAAGSEPDCPVIPEQLPACGFNPTITVAATPSASAWAVAAGAAAAVAAPEPPGSAREDEAVAAARGSAAVPGTPEQAPEGQPTRKVRAVRYDCRTGEQTVHEFKSGSAGLVPRSSGTGQPGDHRHVPPPLILTDFSDLALVDDPFAYPWSANCKIRYKLCGRWREASGALIDERHVLTSGLVVVDAGWGYYDDDDNWVQAVEAEWVNDMFLTPAYDQGDGPWGYFKPINVWSFDSWANHGETRYMLGLVELDRPIGALSGALDYAEWIAYWHAGDELKMGGYPNEYPFLNDRMHWWGGYLDRHGRYPRIERRSYYGLVGGVAWRVGQYDVHYASFVHDWDDSEPDTQFTKIDDVAYDSLSNMIAADKPAIADLIPFGLHAEVTTLASGESLGEVQFHLMNYSTGGASYGMTPFDYYLYLSTDDLITTDDVLLATGTREYDIYPMMHFWLGFYPDPVVPLETEMGDYYLGVIIDVDDSGTWNNDTRGPNAVPIHVYCGPIAAPANLVATEGVYADRIHVSWNAVPDAISYDVWRDETSDPPSSPYATGLTDTSFDDRAPQYEDRYYYWVTAHDDCGHESEFSNADDGWRALLPAPGVTATDGEYAWRVLVTWGAVDGATNYDILRHTVDDPQAPGGEWFSTSETTFDDSFADTGVRYFYWVRATTGFEQSGLSLPDAGWKQLPAPENVTAGDADDLFPNGVEIRWDLVTGAYRYQVSRRDYGGTEWEVISPWKSATTWYDADWLDAYALPGRTYFYRVQARVTESDDYPPGAYSAEDSGWRIILPPSNVIATDGADVDAVCVECPPLALGDMLYCLYRSRNDDPEHALPVSPWQRETSWADETATPGVTYYYWVRAFAVGSFDHLSDFSAADTGWRAEDCNNNGIPDQDDPDAIPPEIVQQPVAQSACVSDAVSFEVLAESPAPMSYQWRKEGAAIAGATSSQCLIGYADPTDAGSYDVVVSSDCGEVVSDAVELVVLLAPAIEEHPQFLTVELGATATFSVTASGNEPLSFRWRKGTVPMSDDGRILGAETDALTIHNVVAEDRAAYDVQVTNSCGTVTSFPAELIVTIPHGPIGGGPFAVWTYSLNGDAGSEPWSWRIASEDGQFADSGDVTVAGVGSGGALAVAQTFADSINAYAASVGCDAESLFARADEPGGVAILSIRTGHRAPSTLFVGTGDTADCEVTAGLPGCQFNPFIEQVLLPGNDCNANGIEDLIEIATGTSGDADDNGVPDECEAEPDQLHVVGPVPNLVPVGTTGAIDATVERNFVGLPGQEVSFARLAGSLTFTAGTIRPDGTQATVVTGSNGIAHMTFSADAVGECLVEVSVSGTPLTAYSVFQIVPAAGRTGGSTQSETQEQTPREMRRARP